MCHRLLFAPGALAGRNAFDLLEKEDADNLKRVLKDMIGGEKSAHREQIRYRRKDGTIFWGDVSLALIQDEGAVSETIIGVVIDISEQKQAAEKLRISREKYRRVFDKSGAASIIIDRDMTITMANEEFEKLTGYGRAEIENRMKWSTFIAPDDLEKMIRYHRQRRLPGGKAPEEYECRIIRRSGEIRHIFIKVGMLPDGIQSIASFMDITGRKQAEKILKEQEVYLRRENVRLKSSIRDRFRFGNIIGKSPLMQQVYERILNAAATDANVIVYGESGTGKELVAQAVHDMSDRRDGHFVVVNCGAIPENLLESEFFGYKKGAFTGAEKNKHGYLDLADGGTLFLDELGEIGLTIQAKLLRVIEGMGYRPVGSDRMHHPDIRIIAATNRDLAQLVRGGSMREDFYYRIHVIPIHLPPLRERKEDIPLLMDHFMRQYGDRNNLPPLTGKMLDAAMAHGWPGNIRELQNVLHRYVTLEQFDVSGADLKKDSVKERAEMVRAGETAQTVETGAGPAVVLPEALDAYEKTLISRALKKNQWHRGRAARSLGIHRRTLFKKIKKYKLDHA
jgi:PAS domain S-box-containing protein